MDYYLVEMGVAKDKHMREFKLHQWFCANLETAIKCANHKAYVFEFKPLSKDQPWKDTDDMIEYYDKGWISIEKKQMWEKEWD